MTRINESTDDMEWTRILKDHVVKNEGDRWGRLICRWIEKKETKTIQHIFAACIDLHSENGDIYLDCSKKKTWVKICSHMVLFPLYAAVKTVYHLALPLSISIEIYLTLAKAKQDRKYKQMTRSDLTQRCIKQIGKNVADIVRTPIYATAMAVVSISAVIIGPLAPKTLYVFRTTLGEMEKSLNWGETGSIWTLYRCFQPYINLKDIKYWRYRESFPDTHYQEGFYNLDLPCNEILRGMTHYARSYISANRRGAQLFNGCKRLSSDLPYISPVAQNLSLGT